MNLNKDIFDKWYGIFGYGLKDMSEDYCNFTICLLENQRIHNSLNELDPRFMRISIPMCFRIMNALFKKGIEIKSDIRFDAKAWRTNIRIFEDSVESRFKPRPMMNMNKEAEWTLELTEKVVSLIMNRNFALDFYLLGLTIDDKELVIYYDDK